MDSISGLPRVASLAILLAVALGIYQIYLQLTVKAKRRALQHEKGTLPVPWLSTIKDRYMGIDIFMENMKALKERRSLELVAKRFDNEGRRTFHSIMLGKQNFVTIEPENLKVIQAVEFKKWGLGSRRKIAFRPLLGVGIFTSDGHDWQHSREMLRPNFARSQVADLDTFERHISHLISAVPKDGTTVDLSELFFRLTLDSATEFLFGESTESLTKGSGEGFGTAFNRGQEYIANSSRWGVWAKLFPANKEWDHDRKFVHEFADHYVRKGMAKRSQLLQEKGSVEKPGRYLFIDELVRQTTDPVRIRSELLNILLAGRDTTASLLTNVWHILSRRPDIWARLQAEVAKLDGAAPTFETLKDMKYLKALLNESLRLHPVVPFNSREALEDTTLPLGGGPDGSAPFFVPKGTVVSWSSYTMHRRKDYYGDDAQEFKPERWLDDADTGRKGLRPGWEYLPFNGGARICLGQQFALTEASYTTVRLCQAFSQIESRDDRPWTEGLTLACVNLYGAKVALKA
ncbi:hypothetical protein LTR62_001601 [Meristemomyces frigidus]|uniref:P450 monooxygenase n=1 Tax=Meristemomyces frigidus TaxID=1508187 RepID=A0AAN7TAW8_9PEZI|nr:hypothetical protein LTR62_001601 [Meristemomyces frigidus]